MEMAIKITEQDILDHPEILDAVKALALVAHGSTSPSTQGVVQNAAPTLAMQNPAPVTQSPAPTAPTQNPLPVMQNPVPTATMQAPAMQNPITVAPTAAPAVYTLEQLSLAAAPLMDAGKTEVLVSLMQSFGVQTLQQLPQERYNDFAVAIRGMGAQI